MTEEVPGQLLEDFVRDLNANFFLREFAISSAKLRVPDGEVEVADTMVCLRDLVLVFQLKERNPSADSSPDALDRWFKEKVSRHAVNQIADTYGYLKQHAGHIIQNDRGHSVALVNPDPQRTGSLVVYNTPAAPLFRGSLGRSSSRVGFVHFIEAIDYFKICQVLRTPIEIVEYLSFRKATVASKITGDRTISERALVGQFLVDAPGPPREKYGNAFDHLVDKGEDDDLSAILQNLGDRIDYRSGDTSQTSYYAILQELALLSRIGLGAFKERLKRCVATAKAGEFTTPYHFSNPPTDCGFLLTPWDESLGIPQEQYLSTLARLVEVPVS